jgi:hypothetical protein
MFRMFNFTIVLLFSFSCKGIENTQSFDFTKDTEVVNSSPAPANNEIPEMGLLIKVEDSGYPFFNLTIEFPERDFSENFVLNIEAVENISINQLNSYIGKYVKFNYTSEIMYDLLDIYHNGTSVFGAEVAPEGEGVKSIEGILYGADQTTNGDLPGEVSVFADDGENHYFSFFITEEMVAVNEKRITAFYDTRISNTIIDIKLVE